MRVAGVDEAGRGPVFGPMVLAVVSVDRERIGELVEMGVADSKVLSPEEREELEEEIKRVAREWRVLVLEPFEIDRIVETVGLNEGEARAVASLLSSLERKPDLVFLDSPDFREERFGERVKRYLDFSPEIVAEHGADAKYPVVSAASILAKVERDRIVRRIEEVYGGFGSGYPHDPLTVSFLDSWIRTFGKLPPFARKSWSTARNALERYAQRSILDWG